MIELRIGDLVAAPQTVVIVYDEGGARAGLAAQTLRRLGYTNATVLDGGSRAWLEAGGQLVQGRNVPSKTFAERMFEEVEVPQITAEALSEWKAAGKPYVLCDIRAPEEHRIGHVPHAHNVPGVEVAALAGDLAAKRVPVIVHCAGRTRSILACQTLRELGLSEVYALKNGTMGWTLAGFELERSVAPSPLAPTAQSSADGARRSRELAAQAGVTAVTAAELSQLLTRRAAGEINCYVFDARQTQPYALEHIRGALALPGGQAVLFADDHVAVRAARIVFVDDGGGQAHVTAYWFRRLGYPHVSVLEGGIAAWREHGGAVEAGNGRTAPLMLREAQAQASPMEPLRLQELIAADPTLRIVDVNTSKNFAAGHIAGARWVSRGWLEPRADEMLPVRDEAVAVVCQNGIQSAYAGATLKALGYPNVHVLAGGLQAWKKAGLPLAASVAPSADDVVKSPYERTKEDMVSYLNWEQQLAKSSVSNDKERP
jgi:rhodanese-related sulfurtransferase